MEPLTLDLPQSAVGQPLASVVRALVGSVAEPILAHGGVWLNGRRAVDLAVPLPTGASVTLRSPPDGTYADVTIAPGDICHEDKWLLVLNKHAGWYTTPTPWDTEGNIRAALGRFLAARDGGDPSFHLVHQLDRDTSGLLLVSKDPQVNAPLQIAFAQRHVAKTYYGICVGVPPEHSDVRTGHGRSHNGRWRTYPLEDVGRTLPAGGGTVKLAYTTLLHERILSDATLVRAVLHTGRTHQIRLHLVELGHPLLGDTRYGGPATFLGETLPFHLLHAAELQLEHPVTKQPLRWVSALPAHFQRVIQAASVAG